MKRCLTVAALAAGAFSFAFASAPTPVAVWDGDFSASALSQYSDSGYTLVDWNETHAADYSTVTIDRANQGLMFNSTAGMSGITVLVRYSGLEAGSSNKRVLATSSVTSGNSAKVSRTGVTLKASGSTGCSGIANGDGWTNADSGNAVASSGVLAFTYSTDGTYLYYGETTDAISSSSLYGSSSLKYGVDTAIYGASIGGFCEGSSASGHEAAQGMTVSGVAVFDHVLSNAEMISYVWPTEIETVTVAGDTSASALNTRIAAVDSSMRKIVLSLDSGATISVDEAFSASVPVVVASSGNITLSASSQPDASYFTAVDFSGVEGALLRSWLAPGVVGFNFNANSGSDTTGALATGTWLSDASSASGSSTALFADGLSTLTWSSPNVYNYSGSSLLNGYLDDSTSASSGARVSLSCVPYETYDVIIYAASDTNPGSFIAKTVNGTQYTWDSASGAAVAGSASWGKAALSTPVYGVNALRIKNLTGPLSIYGGLRATGSSVRGGIAAIQIMPPDTEDNIATYTLTLSGTATTWSAGAWTLNGETVDAPSSGYVKIVATASTSLTVDTAVSLAELTVEGAEDAVVTVSNGESGSLYAIKATIAGGVFKQGTAAVLGATPSIAVEDGATFDLNGLAVNESNAFTISGAGAGDWPWALTSSGGDFPLGTLRSVTLAANAAIGGANAINFGKSGAASYIYYGTYTLAKTGAGNLVLYNGRSNGNGALDIAGGTVTLREFTCLDGYESVGAHTTVYVREGAELVNSTDRWHWVDTLVLDGGTINTSTRTYKIYNNLQGSGELANIMFGAGSSATLSGNLAIAGTMTADGNLSLALASGTEAATVTVGTLSASAGTVSVGAGITFDIGTSRPAASISVDDDATLAVKKSSSDDVPVIYVSAQPANVVLYDENGDVVADTDYSLTYDSEAGTLTFSTLPIWTAASGTAFETAANWSSGATPESGSILVTITGDTAVSLASSYTYSTITVTGSGTVSFTGGTISADAIVLQNGVSLLCDSHVSATTSIAAGSGSVVKIDSKTVGAAISGAGSVETTGEVTLAAANTMTGGITVKADSLLKASNSGAFGSYNNSTAAASLCRVTVEDGGCVDIANVAGNDKGFGLVIAGKGILKDDGTYSGAVVFTGSFQTSEIQNWIQASYLELTDDALVDLGVGWGLIHYQWGESRLVLAGHTLTVRGSDVRFPLASVNTGSGHATTGTIILDGVNLYQASACNLAGVDIIARGSSDISFVAAASAIGSLTLEPTASGMTSSAWNLPSGLVPVVNTSAIDPAALTSGRTIPLFSLDTGNESDAISSETLTVQAGLRYTAEWTATSVTLTVGDPAPFMHYDFDDTNAAASDSTYNIGNVAGTLYGAKNGKAVAFTSSNTPYYDSNTSGVSPFHAGEMTVTALVKTFETDNKIFWNMGGGYGTGIALVAVDSSTVALYSWTGGGTATAVATVTGISNLAGSWHFIAIRSNAYGTTLVVDGASTTVEETLPAAINQCGQFGSIHSNRKTFNALGTEGFRLDDWRVYDCALTDAEIKAMWKSLLPAPFVIRMR